MQQGYILQKELKVHAIKDKMYDFPSYTMSPNVISFSSDSDIFLRSLAVSYI